MTATVVPLGRVLQWNPIQHHALTPAQCDDVRGRIGQVLRSWNGTPYMDGQQCRGAQGGVDCVRFVCGVLDDLYGFARGQLPKLPKDAQMNNPAGAVSVFREVLRIYMPNEIVKNGQVEPGDVIVTGLHEDAFGHSMFVGEKPGELWHSVQGVGVCRTGWALTGEAQKVFAVYRSLDKNKWLKQWAPVS